MRNIFFIFVFTCLVNFLAGPKLKAEVKIYQENDNTGLNKIERIAFMEKYLVNFREH